MFHCFQNFNKSCFNHTQKRQPRDLHGSGSENERCFFLACGFGRLNLPVNNFFSTSDSVGKLILFHHQNWVSGKYFETVENIWSQGLKQNIDVAVQNIDVAVERCCGQPKYGGDIRWKIVKGNFCSQTFFQHQFI